EANPDHPVLQDFVATMRPFAPDSVAFDRFVKQWFFQVVVPEYRLSSVRRAASGGSGSTAWDVTARVTNAGTSRMPVVIAATRGGTCARSSRRASGCSGLVTW